MKLFKNEEEAVSPVIGVILMVAIVVILAAVIAAFVFGMAGTSSTTKTVGTVVSLSQTANGIDVLFTGGSDIHSLRSITVTSNGLASTGVAPAADFLGTAVITKNPATDLFEVGDIATITFDATPQGTRVMLIGTFADGSDQIMFDKVM